MNHLALNERLNAITMLVDEIRRNPHIAGEGRSKQGLLDCLQDIEDTAEAMRHEIAGPRIVVLYLADALEQVQRVTQLMDELELPPDQRQVLSLAMGCELAVEKFRAWRQLARIGQGIGEQLEAGHADVQAAA